MAPTNRQLLMILILLVAFIGFGLLFQNVVSAFVNISTTSLNIAGIETSASFNMPPARIQGLAADVYNSSVILTWRPIMRARLNGYRIYRGDSFDNQIIIGGSLSSGFTDNNVVAGGTYYYRVTAINDLGESMPSSWVRVRIN